MMNFSRASRRLAALGVAAAVLGIAACEQDNISAPVDQIGEPLLDVELQPATPINPSAVVSLPTSDTMVVTLNNLPPLPTGTVYQVLLVDSASNAAVVGSGQLEAWTFQTRPLNRDEAVVDTTADTTSASSIDVWGSNRRAVLTITDADIGGNIAAYSHVIVVATTTPGTGSSTLDPAEQIGFLSRKISAGSLTFGTWSLTSANRQPYSIQGSSTHAAFWGDEFIANFERILRPPQGFEYVAWLIDDRTGIQLRVGGLTTPPPERRSLTNADVEDGSYLTNVAIVEAQVRAPAADPDNYQRVVITLEPKGAGGAPRASTAEVFAANVPVSVSSRHPGAGKLAGKVTGAGSVDSTTVFLTGRGLSDAVLVNITDANGDFLFRTVPVGQYTVKIVPLGGTTVVDSEDITISAVTNPTTGALVGDSVYVTLSIP